MSTNYINKEEFILYNINNKKNENLLINLTINVKKNSN